MGLHKKRHSRPRRHCKGKVKEYNHCKYSINDAALVPFQFIVFSPLTVFDIYGLHPIPLVNSENNKGYIYVTEIVKNCSFWDFLEFCQRNSGGS